MDVGIYKTQYDIGWRVYHHSKDRAKLINELLKHFGTFAYMYKENHDTMFSEYDSILLIKIKDEFALCLR